MNNKKLKKFIEQLKDMAEELDNVEQQNDTAIETDETSNQIAVSSNSRNDGDYFNIRFNDIEIAFGRSFALAGEEYFTAEVDYLGLLASHGKVPDDVQSCILTVWGRSRMYHIGYEIYSLETGELFGTFNESTANLYTVDLAALYRKYGSADFKFVAKWGTAEAVSLDHLEIIEPHPISLSIANPPDKTVYAVGGSFDKTGMQVFLDYSNGTTKKTDNYTLSKEDNLNRSDKYITVKSNGLSALQQIDVISQKVGTNRQVQMRTRNSENSVWGEWTPAPMTKIYVNSTSTLQYRTILTIDKSQIDMGNCYKSGIRLYLTRVSSLNISEGIKHLKINNMSVAVNPQYNYLIAYIGDIKAGETGNLEVIFEYDDYGFEFEAGNIYFCNPTDCALRTEYKDFPLAEGNLSYNVATGQTKFEFTDISADSMPLGIDIKHVFSENENNIGYGDYYRLNLCERLETDAINSNFIVKSHIYTDCYGEKHTFNISFYYEENGERVYITGEEINNINAILLSYNGKPVIIEQITVNNQQYIKVAPEIAQNNAYFKSVENSNDVRALPVKWLKSDNVFKGFNAQGDLVFIIDTYGNYVAVIYNTEGRIENVQDGNGNYVKFKYDAKGNLERISDSRNRIVKYTYSLIKNTNLERVDYGTVEEDGTTENIFKSAFFNYCAVRVNGVPSRAIYRVSNTDKFCSLLNYNGNKFNSKLISLKNYTTLKDETEFEELSVLNIEYDFVDNRTILTDDYGNQQIYKFNDDGDLSNYYEITNGKVSAAERYTYEPYSEYTVTKTQLTTLNIYGINNFKFVAGETIKTKLNLFNQPEETNVSYKLILPKEQKIEKTEYTYNFNHQCVRKVLTEEFKNTSEILTESHLTNFVTTDYVYNPKTGRLVKEISHKSHKQNTGVVNEQAAVTEYLYDEYGSLTRKIYYTVDWDGHDGENCDCSASAASDKFYTDCVYDENRRLIMVGSEDGKPYDSYTYYPGTNNVKLKQHVGFADINYNYDAEDRLKSIGGTVNGIENKNETKYTYGEVAEYNHSGYNALNFEYDEKRRVSSIKLNGSVYETYEYEDKKQQGTYVVDTVTKTNAKGEKFKVIQDRAGSFVKLLYKGREVSEEKYSKDGLLTSVTDKISNRDQTYTYDFCGNITAYSEGSGTNKYSESVTYNFKGDVDSVEHTGVIFRTDKYKYSGTVNERITEYETGDFKVKYSYDKSGRYTGNSAYINTTLSATEKVIYKKENDRATHKPAQLSYMDKVVDEMGAVMEINQINLNYTYDNNDNIKQITKNGILMASYEYDGLNRLIREDNNALGKSYFYGYDENGNITYKEVCGYTVGEHIAGTGEVKTYAYDKDKLISYEGEQCEYDAVGNPVKYRGETLTWTRGKKLKEYGDATFEYDAQGRRIKKNDISYYYDSRNRLIKSSDGMEYYYDEKGIIGFECGGVKYIYRKDVQGNIIGIVDKSGKSVVEYRYDAWGNCTILKDSVLGKQNPFRYRSYFYDEETGLYYLKTRYYDPETGRFLNMDSINYADPETVNGLNLYAYCNNNPVMNVDPDGTWSWKGFGMIIAAICVVAVAVIAVAATAGVATAAIAGAAGVSASMSATIGSTVALTAVAAGAVAGGGEIVNQVVEKGSENINLGSVLVSTVGGAYDGAMIAGTMFTGTSGKIILGAGRVVSSLITSAAYGTSENLSKDESRLDMLKNVLFTTAACFLPSNLNSYSQILFKPMLTGLVKGGLFLGKFFMRHPEYI